MSYSVLNGAAAYSWRGREQKLRQFLMAQRGRSPREGGHYEKGYSPGPADELASELRQLEQLIEGRIEPAEVRHLTQQLAPRLIQQLNVMSYPRAAPDLARGQELYSQNCAKCHGPQGDGRGPSAAEQDPPPSSFQEERMNDLPPYCNIQLYFDSPIQD